MNTKADLRDCLSFVAPKHFMLAFAVMLTLACKVSVAGICGPFDAPNTSHDACKQRVHEYEMRDEPYPLKTSSTKPVAKFAVAHNLVALGAYFWCEFETVSPETWTVYGHETRFAPSESYTVEFGGNGVWRADQKPAVANLSSGSATVNLTWGPDSPERLYLVPSPNTFGNASFSQDGDSVTIKEFGGNGTELGGKVNLAEGSFVGTFHRTYSDQMARRHLAAGNFKCEYWGFRQTP